MSETTVQTATDSAAGAAARHALGRLREVAGAPLCCTVQAPVMLDVMGGIAELTGSLALAIPTREFVRVAVAPRIDQRLRIARVAAVETARAQRNGRDSEQVWDLSAFYTGNALASPLTQRDRLTAIDCRLHQAVLTGAYALLLGGLAAHLAGGFTILVETDRDDAALREAHFLAAVQDATCTALLQALGVTAERKRIAECCRAAHGAVFPELPTGFMTQAGPLLGKSGELLQVCCGSFDVGAPLPLPAGVTVLGIDCGALHPHADDKYGAAYTAALMGREIIAKLMPRVCPQARWDGLLARVSVTDFVDQLRDRIPTKLKGLQYLERFVAPDGAPTPVDPATVYKVRSRAEHHIYEEERVRQFAERLTRARRTSDETAVREAGELMYASHWSYGQRCGLGSIETDLLVSMLRAEGASQGIFGARVSGTGCGGTVVVLLRDNHATVETVQRVLDRYRERVGHAPVLRRVAEHGAPGLVVQHAS